MQSSTLLKKYSKHKPCYYCGEPPPSSREHAPVQSMFEAFRCDSITVPSCDKHNSAKNLDDRAILALFAQGLYPSLRTGTLTGNQLRALQAILPKLGNAKEVALRPMVTEPKGELNAPLPHIDETNKVKPWMRQLTAALVWSVIGDFDPSTKWDESLVWSPDCVLDKGLLTIEEARSKLKTLQLVKANIDRMSVHWWSGWSSFPNPYPRDVYYFEISFLPSLDQLQGAANSGVIFRHWFYAKACWYVWCKISQEARGKIADAVDELAARGKDVN